MRFSWKGCLIGCGVLVLLFVIAGIISAWWLVKKEEFQTETTILAENSEFYLRSYLSPEDKVLVDFFGAQATRMRELNPAAQGFPQFFRDWEERKTYKDIKKMLPLELELAGRLSEDDLNFSIGFSVYNNMASLGFWFLKRQMDKKGALMQHNGKEYIALLDANPPFYLTLHDNIVYFARSENGMRAMLEGSLADHGEDDRLIGVDLDAPIYGFALNEAAHSMIFNLSDVLEMETTQMAGEASNSENLAGLNRIGFDMRTPDQDTLAGRLLIDMEQSEEARYGLNQLLDRTRAEMALELTYTIEDRSDGYLVRFEITGFEKALDEIGDRLDRQLDEEREQ